MTDVADPPEDRCAACDRTIGWIDGAMACPSGCLYCVECAGDVGGTCSSCGEPLVRRPARARALPR